jgi:hypothetical protein
MCGPRAPRWRRPCRCRTRAHVQAWLEVEDGLDRRVPPVGESEEGKEREEPVGLGRRGLGQLATRWRERKKEKAAGLGLAGRNGEKGKRKREWAGPKEKEREKKKCI